MRKVTTLFIGNRSIIKVEKLTHTHMVTHTTCSEIISREGIAGPMDKSSYMDEIQ